MVFYLEILEEKFCPKCGSTEPGKQHKDGRYKCKTCSHKYSQDKNIIDYWTLFTFSYFWSSAYWAAKFLKNDYKIAIETKRVYRRYMKYRQEIFDYTEKSEIPKQPSITKIMQGETIKGHKDFCKFAKEQLKGIRNIHKNNLPLYQRDIEFRFHYWGENLYTILWKIHFGWDIKY